MRAGVLAAAVATMLGVSVVHAQPINGPRALIVKVGDRVRIGVTDSVARTPMAIPSRHLIGIVRGIVPDTLYLEATPGAQPTAIARLLITDVELSLGRPSRLKTARDWGFAGSVYGGLAMMRRTENHTGTENSLMGAAVGGTLGLLVGFFNPREPWRTAWLPE